MKFITNIGLGVFSFALIASNPVMADVHNKDQKKDEVKKESSAALKQVEGTIVQHKLVNVFPDKSKASEADKTGKADKAEKQLLVVLLKTDKGNDRLIVDLGAVKDVPKIKDGESKLQVEGQLVEVGAKELFVAKRANLNGNDLEIKRKS